MSSTYQPGKVPDPQGPSAGVLAPLIRFLRTELASLKRGLEDAKPHDEYVVLHAEPSRVRAGMVVYADGSDWNPGSGEGVYRRNAANTAWVFLGATFSFRNRLINGNFGVNQRGVAAASTAYGAGVYTLDRWKAGAGGVTLSFATAANVTTVTITAGTLVQVIEGNNLQSGTHVLSWTGTAQGRIDGGAYGVTGLAGAATGGTNMTVEFNTGTLSLVQLEPGTASSPFEHRLYGVELALCQRYYEKSYDISTSPGTNTGLASSIEEFGAWSAGSAVIGRIRFAVSKRASPSTTIYDPQGTPGKIGTEGTNNNITPTAVDNHGTSGFKIYHASVTRISFHWVASAEL